MNGIGKGVGVLEREEEQAPSPLSQGFCPFFQAWILREIPGEDFNRIFTSFSRCVLSGSWAPLISQDQGRGSLVMVAGPGVSHSFTPSDFAAFLSLQLKHS